MTPPIAPVVDPSKDRIRRNIQKMADQGASQDEIETYLTSEGLAPKPQAAPSLKLDVRTPTESTRALPFNRPDPTGDVEAIGNTPAALALVAGQALPGAERYEAAMGSLGSKFTDKPLSYKESLDALRSETDQIPGPIKLAAQGPLMMRAAGAKVLSALSPTKAGALIGGADQALSADEMTPTSRALRTVAGAGVGSIAGKVADVGATGTRAAVEANRAPGKLLPTIAPRATTAKTLARIEAERTASATPLYDKAFAEGRAAMGLGDGATPIRNPKVQALFQRPEVAEIASGLQQLDEFANVPLESPEMLDGLFKVLSDRKSALAKRLDAVTPGRPNLGRFDKRQVQSVQNAVLDATDDVMPSYRAAVADYAENSARLKGAMRGHDAVRSRLNRNLPMAKSLKNTSPESYDTYLQGVSPDVADEAERGILGGTKAAFGQSARRSGIPALLEAPALLRKTNTPQQRAIDQLIRLGLFSGATATP